MTHQHNPKSDSGGHVQKSVKNTKKDQCGERGRTLRPIAVVVGTRPEIIKMASIIHSLKSKRIPYVLIHCGQHYHYRMSEQFIRELELPEPDHSLATRAYTQGTQTASIIVQMENLLKRILPGLVLVEGDTNGVLATALAAVKLGIPVGHVEAGLRSFDLRMPEEHNRRLTDHVSSFLFPPTTRAENNLRKESVWGKTWVTGNTVIDAVIQYMPIAESKSKILDGIKFKTFALATAHRAENVDDPKVLRGFLNAFEESPIPIVCPMHPRTKNRLMQKLDFSYEKTRNVQVLPPLGYFDFLMLMKSCQLIITDSGGIQEEATAPCIRKPVLVTRLSTERPEAVEEGFAEIVGTNKGSIIAALNRALSQRPKMPKSSPYGDGNASRKIVEIIQSEMNL